MKFEIGQKFQINAVEGPLAQRLSCMGLVSGDQIEVIQVAPFGDPIFLKVRGSTIALRREEIKWLKLK